MKHALDTWRLTGPSAATIAAAWVIVVGATRLSMPQIDPSQLVTARPMESLATLTLVLPVVTTLAVLPARMPWLAQVAGRDLRGWRAGLLAALLVPQAGAVAVVAQVGRLPLVQVAGVWLLLLGLGLLTLTAIGQRLAGLAPAVVVLTFSQASGIPPWSWNLVYNLDRQPALLAIDALLVPAAVLAYAGRGDRQR